MRGTETSDRKAQEARLTSVVRRLFRHASPEILAEPDEISVLASLLEKEWLVTSVEMDDPLRGARIRGLRMRQELLKAAGGGLRPSDVSELLGITTSGVTKKRSRNQILAVDLPGGDWVYPQVQFSTSGIIEGLGDVLAAFHPATEPWTRLNVLMGSVEGYDAANVFELLQAGEVQEAINIAATYGSGS
jgi:hypothetical protein